MINHTNLLSLDFAKTMFDHIKTRLVNVLVLSVIEALGPPILSFSIVMVSVTSCSRIISPMSIFTYASSNS